ncbi:ABC transporter permease [Pelagibius sp.]|uniref:ABC transporter permease n=1 Tax=Pelagibius sp. TaxID=1931238 RepID=UPI003B50BA35
MGVYALKRVGLAVLIVLSALFLLFVGVQFIPGDAVTLALGPKASPEAVARYTEKMGLDDPVVVQFLIFIGNALQGDLGQDILSGRDVTLMVLEEFPYTLALALAGLGWAVAVGVPLGCLSAVWPNSWADRITGVLAVGTSTIPSFLVAIWSLLIFAIALKWLPVIGAGEPGNLTDQLRHLILPAFAVGLGWVGYLARMVRASMLEVLGENYIKAARAFGLPTRTVIYRYALKVAILPIITLIGLGFGGMLNGAVFAEIIFTRPGLGTLAYEAVLARNFPVVQGTLLVVAGLYVLTMLTTDLVIAWLDPRVRESL